MKQLRFTFSGPKTVISRILVYIFLGVLGLICIVPFYATLVTATLNFNSGGLDLLPDRFLISNFTNLFFRLADTIPFAQAYLNSMIIAISTTVLTTYFGIFTAYGFSLYSFRGKKVLWGVLLALMMIPQTVTIIGYYKLVVAFDMINTYWPLILPGIANSYVVFYLRQYITSVIPISLVEAARVEGARDLAIFHRIIMPNVLPGISPIIVIIFLQSWNSYQLPMLIINKPQLETVPIIFSLLSDFNLANLSAAFSMITMVLLVALLLRFMVQSNTKAGLNE